MKNITAIAQKAGIPEQYLEQYGKYKAKIDLGILESVDKEPGKLVLVTAINPTPAGEGKTTVTIGLHEALRRLGVNSLVALREPSLGPVFGIKGGATGGGKSQITPADEINLHFTGDMHAIGAAANLLAAIIDNHIYWGNELNIDPERITWKRCLDVNDRQLRHITGGQGGSKDGVPHKASFEITARSEIMAVLCLSTSLEDLQARLEDIIVAYTYDGAIVTVKDLQVSGALTALLKDALKPNLVQTLEGNPALIHGGPFANIAHGCNSVIATQLARKLADVAITEAGFGADLGAEKFFDIKCRQAGLVPDAVIIVATVRALKMHGGLPLEALQEENLEALAAGMENLLRHIDNVKNVFNLPCLVAINRFSGDSAAELQLVKDACEKVGVQAEVVDVFAQGGAGAVELATALTALLQQPQAEFKFAYDLDADVQSKLETLVKRIYRGKGVNFAPHLESLLTDINAGPYRNLPICVAKTPYSFSDNGKLLGAPQDFVLNVTDISISAGAKFIVAYSGNVLGMPGLGKKPAAFNISVNDAGEIVGIN